MPVMLVAAASGCTSVPVSPRLIVDSHRLIASLGSWLDSLLVFLGNFAHGPRQYPWVPVVSAPRVFQDAEHCKFQGQDFFLLLIFSAVVLTAVRSRRATIRQRLELARSMAERGLQPPAELLRAGAAHDLHRGILLLATGVGLLLAAYFAQVPGLSPAGLIPICIGGGYVLSHRLSLRYQRETTRGE